MDWPARVTWRAREASMGDVDLRTRLDDDVANADVFSRRPHERTALDGPRDRDALAVGGDVLLRYDGVRSVGQRGTREDPHRLARPQCPGGQPPRQEPAADDPPHAPRP